MPPHSPPTDASLLRMPSREARRKLFERHAHNPILTVADWPYAANAVFNPAAAVVDGEAVILARVEQPARHLAVARSTHGVDQWTVDRGGLPDGRPARRDQAG